MVDRGVARGARSTERKFTPNWALKARSLTKADASGSMRGSRDAEGPPPVSEQKSERPGLTIRGLLRVPQYDASLQGLWQPHVAVRRPHGSRDPLGSGDRMSCDAGPGEANHGREEGCPKDAETTMLFSVCPSSLRKTLNVAEKGCLPCVPESYPRRSLPSPKSPITFQTNVLKLRKSCPGSLSAAQIRATPNFGGLADLGPNCQMIIWAIICPKLLFSALQRSRRRKRRRLRAQTGGRDGAIVPHRG